MLIIRSVVAGAAVTETPRALEQGVAYSCLIAPGRAVLRYSQWQPTNVAARKMDDRRDHLLDEPH
jgi:hypothetical protein